LPLVSKKMNIKLDTPAPAGGGAAPKTGSK
jgi:hypothetical protein